tara:strand:- start:2461 stop:3255 length:795 start_codon:yes stop_codon:yes gene_type:complete
MEQYIKTYKKLNEMHQESLEKLEEIKNKQQDYKSIFYEEPYYLKTLLTIEKYMQEKGYKRHGIRFIHKDTNKRIRYNKLDIVKSSFFKLTDKYLVNNLRCKHRHIPNYFLQKDQDYFDKVSEKDAFDNEYKRIIKHISFIEQEKKSLEKIIKSLIDMDLDNEYFGSIEDKIFFKYKHYNVDKLCNLFNENFKNTKYQLDIKYGSARLVENKKEKSEIEKISFYHDSNIIYNIFNDIKDDNLKKLFLINFKRKIIENIFNIKIKN